MPNPFDQFDAGTPAAEGSNPFDAFDAGAPAPAAEPVNEYVALGEKVKAAAPDLRKVPASSMLSLDNLKRGMGVLFSKKSPWERYKESVDQAFETALPEIHRYEAPTGEGAGNRTLQTAAAVENVANQAAAGTVSPGGISVLNPITGPAAILYATPRFIGQGLEALGNIGKDKTAQENIESGIGGLLGVAGGVAGGVHGVKGMKAQIPRVEPPPVPKGPSIVEQMDGDTKGTPSEANLQANQIAMKPVGTVPPAEPTAAPNPGDTAIAAINKGILDSAPKSAPIVETKTGRVSRTDKANYEDYVANKKVFDAAIEKHLDDPTNPNLEAEFQKAFAKNEEIKNRNGGFAPEPPNEKVSTLLEGDNFDKEWKEQGGQGGSENQVIFQDGQVIKRNYNQKLGQALVNYGGDINKFNESVELHNELFPSTKMDIIGVSETSDGPAPVVSQVEVKGKPATQKEIIDFMRKKGFEPDGGPNYLNKEAGVRVEDLRTANVLKDSNGDLHVIDSVIKKVGDAQEPKPTIPAAKLADVVPGSELPAEPARTPPAPEPIARPVSAVEKKPSSIEALVTPDDIQVLADDLDVHQILADIEDNAAPSERSSPIAEAATRFLTGASVQETTPRVGGRPPMPPIGNQTAQGAAGGQPYKQGLTGLPLGLGKIAEAAKIIAGTIEGNIRDASKKVFGVLRNYEYAKTKLSQQFQQATLPASRLARKILTKAGNDEVGNLLMSGKVDEAKRLVDSSTRYGAEFSSAIDAVRKALDYAHSIASEARDGAVNYVKDYFPRQMIDYREFRKFLGKDEQSVVDQAIKRAQEASETVLTQEQVEAVMNDLISQSRRGGGKPGFLKPRTIAEIDSKISQFYEPWDVALENYLNKVTNDVVNRAYLGKFDPTSGALWDPRNGHFGKIIAEEVAAGRLTGKAADIVIDNLQDRFKIEQNVKGVMAGIGRRIRFAQSAAYLGQLQTAVAQFGDVFGSILHQGPLDTIKGYGNRRFDLADIGLHEGNVETAQFSRRKGLVDKAADLTIKFGVGLSDQFNKGGVANAIARHYADVVKNPMSDAFHALNRDYSAKFPDQWPQMLKELRSRAFEQGNIKELPNAQFFLYNEMADIHPINPSGMAQGFNAAHPLAKPFWGLKSYMIKQLDIMRARGYERIKNPQTRGEGLAYLAAYAAVVAAGQNFAVSWLRDKLANRDTDTSDYFIGGFLQPLGLSRYTITQMKQGEYGKAAAETILPIFSIFREGTNDAGLLRDLVRKRRDLKTRQRTVSDIGDLVSQSELVKHFPVVGSLYYSREGKGAANEKKRREEKAKGKGQPNTFETFRTIVAPDETAKR